MQEGLLVIDSYTMILSGNSSAWKLFQLKDPKIGDSVYSLNRNEDFRLLIETGTERTTWKYYSFIWEVKPFR